MKRASVLPGGIIEARRELVDSAFPVVLFLVAIVADVTFAIFWISDDDPVRGNDVDSL